MDFDQINSAGLAAETIISSRMLLKADAGMPRTAIPAFALRVTVLSLCLSVNADQGPAH